MLDHTGRHRVRYEDAFRALGHYLDSEHFTQIAVIETPEGFLVKGHQRIDNRASQLQLVPQTYLFTNEDIDRLLEAAYARRRG